MSGERSSAPTPQSFSPSRFKALKVLAFFAIALVAILFAPQIQLRASVALKQLARHPTSIHITPPTTVSRSHSTRMSPSQAKYSAREEKEWNQLAEKMQYFHNHFRQSFESIYELADGRFHAKGMSLKMFVQNARMLSQQLEMHHNIEERHIFPILGRKMPQFKAGARESGEHLVAHKGIHDGLDRYNALLDKYLEEPSSYSPTELRACLDSFRQVLFSHLDEEVEDIKGESLKKAGWTLTEIRQIPM